MKRNKLGNGITSCRICATPLDPTRRYWKYNRERCCSQKCVWDLSDTRASERRTERRKSIPKGSGNDPVRIITDLGGYLWPPEDIIAALKRWSKRHGGASPSERVFRANGAGKGGAWRPIKRPPLPSLRQMILAFGSFNAALKAAGLETREWGCPPTKERCKRGHPRPNTTIYGSCKECRKITAPARKARLKRTARTEEVRPGCRSKVGS